MAWTWRGRGAEVKERSPMRATAQDRVRLEEAVLSLTEQLKALGAVRVILFGSLARGEISLFSDIDMLVLFDLERPSHELTRWVYQQIRTGEAIDILAYGQHAFQKIRDRPFFHRVLQEGKVLYERPGT